MKQRRRLLSRHAQCYYTYTLRYPDRTIFYVGFGHGNRIRHHEYEAHMEVQSPKCDVIRAIWQSGNQVIAEKDQENLTRDQAIDHERLLIQEYGRENLTNKTSGARGSYEHLPTERQRQYYQRRGI